MELPNIFKRKKRLSLHTKLALTFTVSLLAIITAAFCALEFNNSLANESMLQKILSSFSYSTMCRTAGINFTSLGTITNGTMMITMIGMFIGRMGPLFLISSVIKKDEGYQAWPSEENIMIG